jgi:hypothetical protein
MDRPEPRPGKDRRYRLGQAGAVGEYPQRGHPDHADYAVAVGADAEICGPSGKLMHVESASSQETMTDVAITIFPCAAGTFAYPELTKRSQGRSPVNV